MLLGSTSAFDFINNYLFHWNAPLLEQAFQYKNEQTGVYSTTRLPFVAFDKATTANFITELGNAIKNNASLPQIRLFMAIKSAYGKNPHYTPVLHVHTDGVDKGFVLKTGDFSSLPASFTGYQMLEVPTHAEANDIANAVKDPHAPAGSTELTNAQKSAFVKHYAEYTSLKDMFFTTDQKQVQHYSFTQADSKDIHDKAVAMGGFAVLRCVLGANPTTTNHPVKFRPILELINTNPMHADIGGGGDGGDTYWDFSTPCPPNCGKGH